MPRSIQESLDHGDELAKRFEDDEPTSGDERDVKEYLLERATLARAQSERHLVEAVTAARSKGMSWQRIGTIPRNLSAGCAAALRSRRGGQLTRPQLTLRRLSRPRRRSGQRRAGSNPHWDTRW